MSERRGIPETEKDFIADMVERLMDQLDPATKVDLLLMFDWGSGPDLIKAFNAAVRDAHPEEWKDVFDEEDER